MHVVDANVTMPRNVNQTSMEARLRGEYQVSQNSKRKGLHIRPSQGSVYFRSTIESRKKIVNCFRYFYEGELPQADSLFVKNKKKGK